MSALNKIGGWLVIYGSCIKMNIFQFSKFSAVSMFPFVTGREKLHIEKDKT